MSGALVRSAAGGQLERVGIDTLAGAYDWLLEVQTAHAAFLVRLAEERRGLDDRARYLVGSLDAARRFLGPEHGGDAPVDGALAEAQAELSAARSEVEAWAQSESDYLTATLTAAQDAVIERVEAWRKHRRPPLTVRVARIAGGRRVVHLDRPDPDDAVVLCRLLAGRPPLRPDFLVDDAVEEMDGAVHLALRFPGVDPEAIHAGGVEAEDALSRDAAHRLLPIRAHLPVLLPDPPWPRLRLRARGPVLELEARGEGAPYTHLVAEAEAELFTGYLVSLKIRGAVEVEVVLE